MIDVGNRRYGLSDFAGLNPATLRVHVYPVEKSRRAGTQWASLDRKTAC